MLKTIILIPTSLISNQNIPSEPNLFNLNWSFTKSPSFKGHFKQRSKEQGPMKSSIHIGQEL
jgi:hypothetical protein